MHKKRYIIFGFIFVLVILSLLVWNKGIDIVVALLTAIITSILLYVFKILDDYFSLIKYKGYWLVLENNGENYISSNAFVEIKILSYETLTYSFTSLNNLDNIVGTIFINQNNKKTGKLICGFKQINQAEGLNPVWEKSVYFDLNNYKTKKSVALIRILDSKGEEKFVLERPDNQKEFEIKIKDLHKETVSSLAIPFPQELIDKNDKTRSQKPKIK